MRNPYHSEKDFRKIRARALIIGLLVQSFLIFGLFWQQQKAAEQAKLEEMQFGSSGGGGGEGEQDEMIQFGPQSNPPDGEIGRENITKFTMLDIEIYDDLTKANPVPKKEDPKPALKVKKKSQRRQTIVAENLPTRWVRRG